VIQQYFNQQTSESLKISVTEFVGFEEEACLVFEKKKKNKTPFYTLTFQIWATFALMSDKEFEKSGVHVAWQVLCIERHMRFCQIV